MNYSQTRDASLQSSHKMAATFSEGFSSQYNSPKTIGNRGFTLSKPYNQEAILLPRQKNVSSIVQNKSSKTFKSTSSALENPTTSHRPPSSSSAANRQPSTSKDKDEKRSLSKTKCETLRTVSSTPKNVVPAKSAESVRKEDTSFNSSQYKWKKLEISTDYNSTKASYATKAQSTKHTETDENSTKEATAAKLLGKQYVTQSLSKSNVQTKSDTLNSYAFYLQQNNIDEAKARNNDRYNSETKSRTPRVPTSYDSNSKASTNTPDTAKKTGQRDNSKPPTPCHSDRDNSATKLSYRKNATPKGSPTSLSNEKFLSTVNGDLKSSWPASSETLTRKSRPLSAKKPGKDASERANSKEDKNDKAPPTPTQKVSLQNFVTKVNKGDVFSSIKKYGEKRENSTTRSQKPQLNIDEKVSKPVRAIELDLKGSKTTTNQEAKAFSNTLTKSALQLSLASASQSLGQKNKNTKMAGQGAKEQPLRASQEIIMNPQPAIQEKEPFIYYMTNLRKAHRSTGDLDYFMQIYREHFLQSFHALTFCKSLKPTDNSVIAQKKVNLPRKECNKDKKTLVFDMDETLIHCNESTDMPSDVILPILFPTGEVIDAGINIRPYAVDCLKELSQYYEIVVFTASHACYANVVLDYLDPNGEYIHHRLFRESCVVTEEGVHIKDLRVIGNRNLQDVILVDNAAYSFGLQIENGIPIIPFYESKEDQELRHLIPYLKFLNSVKDLREINKQTFKLKSYTTFDTPEAVLENIILQD